MHLWKQFKFIHPGEWFDDGRKKPRRFIKISNCGNQEEASKLELVCVNKQTGEQVIPIRGKQFNAVDTKGCLAVCPDWVQFRVLGRTNELRFRKRKIQKCQ